MSKVFGFLVANPNDPGGWGQWLQGHYLDHVQIQQAAMRMRPGAEIPIYDLGLWMPDLDGWAGDHQAMHDAINNLFGGQGLDMSQIDWQDEQSWSTFLSNNAAEHQNFWKLFRIT